MNIRNVGRSSCCRSQKLAFSRGCTWYSRTLTLWSVREASLMCLKGSYVCPCVEEAVRSTLFQDFLKGETLSCSGKLFPFLTPWMERGREPFSCGCIKHAPHHHSMLMPCHQMQTSLPFHFPPHPLPGERGCERLEAPEKLWVPHPWRHSRPCWMGSWAA